MGAFEQVVRGEKGVGREGESSVSTRVEGWLLVLMVALVAGFGGPLAACSGTEPTTPSEGTATTIQQATTSTRATTTTQTTATTQATATTSPTHEIQVFKDIRFMAERNSDSPPLLDVYAPKAGGALAAGSDAPWGLRKQGDIHGRLGGQSG